MELRKEVLASTFHKAPHRVPIYLIYYCKANCSRFQVIDNMETQLQTRLDQMYFPVRALFQNHLILPNLNVSGKYLVILYLDELLFDHEHA